MEIKSFLDKARQQVLDYSLEQDGKKHEAIERGLGCFTGGSIDVEIHLSENGDIAPSKETSAGTIKMTMYL